MEGGTSKRFFAFVGYHLEPKGGPTTSDRYARKANKLFDKLGRKGVNGYIYRVAASPKFSSPFKEIQQRWTTRELVHAMRWLDTIDEMERFSQERIKQKMKPRG